MDTFFTYFKKSLVATIMVMFAFVVTYTPQDWNKVEYAHANYATEGTQILNNIQLFLIHGVNTVIQGFTGIISWATTNLWIKENILDGLAWYAAKAVVRSLLNTLISWINSGFDGKPMFVQDLKEHLRIYADQAIGEYLSEIDSLGSFICDPFRVKVATAVSIQYEQIDKLEETAPKCTLWSRLF